METYKIVRTRMGSTSKEVIGVFQGSSVKDNLMLKQIKDYLLNWLKLHHGEEEEHEGYFREKIDKLVSYGAWYFWQGDFKYELELPNVKNKIFS